MIAPAIRAVSISRAAPKTLDTPKPPETLDALKKLKKLKKFFPAIFERPPPHAIMIIR
jgi:hypothetical protein